MARKYNPDDYHKQSFILVRWIERLRVRAILRELDPKKSDTILEVGCGAGNILECLSIGRAVGLDLSTDLLEIAKTKNYRIKSDLIHAFGESLPFRDESVDKVICSEVLEHVRQPADICAEASRVLKADGRFVFSVPNENLINSLKGAMRKCYVDRAVNFVSGYRFPTDMTEEWHLHSFDAEYAKEIIRGIFDLENIRFVPSPQLCLRIVVSCCKPR